MKCAADHKCLFTGDEIRTGDDICYLAIFRTKYPAKLTEVIANVVDSIEGKSGFWLIYHTDCAKELGIKVEEG